MAVEQDNWQATDTAQGPCLLTSMIEHAYVIGPEGLLSTASLAQTPVLAPNHPHHAKNGTYGSS